MANRDEHDVLGLVFGVAAVAISAGAAGRRPSAPELLGGALLGVAGSRVPDLLEPATSPNHRGPAHSVAAIAATGRFGIPALHRAHLAGAAAADVEVDALARFVRQFAAGSLVGIAAGYASHLAADAKTPKGIPLLGL